LLIAQGPMTNGLLSRTVASQYTVTTREIRIILDDDGIVRAST
jgi:hypothetical protein